MSDKDNKNKEAITAKKEFWAKKQLGTAITWFVCAVLLIPCYIATKIWAMAVLVPILLLLGVGALVESMKSMVKFEDNNLTLQDAQGLHLEKQKINAQKIISAVLDTSEEKDEEIIHSITLNTTEGPVNLPDVDDKPGLLNRLKKIRPKMKVEKIK